MGDGHRTLSPAFRLSVPAGVLSEVVGVPWTVAVGALVCAIAGLLLWLVVRRNPSTPEPGH